MFFLNWEVILIPLALCFFICVMKSDSVPVKVPRRISSLSTGIRRGVYKNNGQNHISSYLFCQSNSKEEEKKKLLNDPCHKLLILRIYRCTSVCAFYGNRSGFHLLGFFNCHFKMYEKCYYSRSGENLAP